MGLLDLANLPSGPLPQPYDHLVLGDRLGEPSGEGFVYEAFDGSLGAYRAVKFFKRQGDGGASLPLQLRREWALECDKLKCPWLPYQYQFIDLGDVERYPEWQACGFTMEFLEYGFADLESLVKQRGPVPSGVIVGWLRQLIGALQFLHADGWVHRDLKPDNIRFRGEGAYDSLEAVVIDLGVMQRSGYIGLVGRVVANDKFKLSELYAEGEPVSEAMDLYAFGKLIEFLQRFSDDPNHLPWLNSAKRACLEAPRSMTANTVERMLSVTWRTQEQHYRAAGFAGVDADYVERGWVLKAFGEYAERCRGQNRGGVFVLTAPMGWGKTTLMSAWSDRARQYQGFRFKFENKQTVEQLVGAIGNQLFELLRGLAGEATAGKVQEQCLSSDYKQHLGNWLDEISRQLPREKGDLCLFIDALDEADSQEEAERVVAALPDPVPAGCFFVLTSRPPLEGWTHLTKLRGKYRDVLEDFSVGTGEEGNADTGDKPARGAEENRDDVTTYLLKHSGQSKEWCREMARACGYLFQLAALQIQDIRRGLVKPEAALADSHNWVLNDPGNRLFGYYQASWDRLRAALGRGGAGEPPRSGLPFQLVENYCGAMLAVLDDRGIDTGSLAEWLTFERERAGGREKVGEAAVEKLHGHLLWFVRPVFTPGAESLTYYQVRHKSVRDFLTRPPESSARSDIKGPIQVGVVREWHVLIADYYLTRQLGWPAAAAWADAPPPPDRAAHVWDYEVSEYGKRHLVQHLCQSLPSGKQAACGKQVAGAWLAAAAVLTSWNYLGACLSDRAERV